MKKILSLLALTVTFLTWVLPSRSAEPSGSGLSKASPTAPTIVDFERVTVKDATNMHGKPTVTSESSLPAAKLKIKDLVVGKGRTATPDSLVTVQYVGVRYADGKQFDSSWDKRGAANFRLDKAVRGFSQGIGGNESIPPMKVGGRRLMIVPSELAYGESGTTDGSVPPNATLVFVVDLIAVR